MLAALLFSLAVSANPLDKLVQLHPGSARIRSGDGQRLVHLSGFAARTGARTPDAAARSFLAAHGPAFGVTGRHALVLRSAPAPGATGPVRFGRTIDGLPLFGGDLVLGVDASNRVFLVNAGDVAPSIAGRHAIGESAAARAALVDFPGGVRGAGPVTVAAGWHPLGAAVRAVYQVDFVASDPAGDWRTVVDAETGAALFRIDLRSFATAPGSAFEVSPAETAASLCPPSGGGTPTLCAAPASVTFPNLTTAADLHGSQTTVFNCNGANDPTSPAGVPGTCANVSAVNGAFNFPVDATFQATSDDFAAAMAYFHLDRHVSFFKRLDPAIPPVSAGNGGSSQALRGSLPALVNNFDANAPFENAFFSPGLDAMVFGQGSQADYAYDATIMYHELTHGVVWAWGGFNPSFDSLGTNWEAFALNEGTADSMAVAETGRSRVGGFLAAVNQPPLFGGRDLLDANASRTCQGDGTVVTRFGAPGINGLDGEEHDDGEIWNGFFWEVFDGLRTAGIKGCGGACEAGSAIQYGALRLAAGTSPTFDSYWQTFKAAASTLFPANPAVASYVDCVARRRKLDRCDRTVPVLAGESKVMSIRVRFSPFQVTVPTSGDATVTVCSAQGSSATLYGRVGQPVQITEIDGTGTATVVSDGSLSLTKACSAGPQTVTLTGGGTWFLLVDLGPSGQRELFRIDAGQTNVAARTAPTAPPTCSLAAPVPLSIQPAAPSVPPRGQTTFTASGGAGAGFTWSLATNASGGTINPSSGAYTAGSVGNVTDVVKVTDSLGASTTQNVSVTAGVSISPASASAAPGGSVSFAASGGSGAGFAWSMASNPSGATINSSSGAYTAGSTGSVTDVVRATDSLGNVATASVSVSPASQGAGGGGGTTGGGGGGCSATGTADAPALALALAALLRSRTRRRPRKERA